MNTMDLLLTEYEAMRAELRMYVSKYYIVFPLILVIIAAVACGAFNLVPAFADGNPDLSLKVFINGQEVAPKDGVYVTKLRNITVMLEIAPAVSAKELRVKGAAHILGSGGYPITRMYDFTLKCVTIGNVTQAYLRNMWTTDKMQLDYKITANGGIEFPLKIDMGE
jgi:hypothetical protein